MGVVAKIRSVIGSSGESDKSAEEDPSHRCQSCGEEYFTDPDIEIPTCRACGGTKIEPVA